MVNAALKNLFKNWQLGAIKKIKRFRSGQVNESYYILSTHGEYVLRIYKYKKEAEAAFETALLNSLKGLPVPQIVLIDGQAVIKIGSWLAIVYKYIPGQCLKKITAQQRKAVGKVLARIHNQTKNFQWAGKRNEYYNFSRGKIRLFSRVVAKSAIPLQDRFQSLKADIVKYRLSPSLPRGPIHVDVKPENVLFYKGKLSGVIDFDNSYIGPRLLDLTKTIVWFGLKDKQLNLRHAKDIYEGYASVRKLTPAEYKELYKAIKFAYISHLFDVFYMAALKRNSLKYFKFLMNDFYSSYKNFNLSYQDFYEYFPQN